jgi:hypothetical protein
MGKRNGYDRYLDYQYGSGGSFFKALFDAIKQADYINLAKIELGFPEEVEAYKTWTRVGVEPFVDKLSPDHHELANFKAEYGLEG